MEKICCNIELYDRLKIIFESPEIYMQFLDCTLDLLGSSWHFFFLKTALLRYNLQLYNLTGLKYIIQ